MQYFCLGLCCYSVSYTHLRAHETDSYLVCRLLLEKKFLSKNKNNKIFFNFKKDKIYFDLANYVKSELKLNKITKIDMLNIDTFIKKNNYFSARRAITSGHDDYGRNISIIMIN